MSRPRAGHARTYAGNVAYMMDAMGEWITCGEACGWPRCARCRKPERAEHLIEGLCSDCWFHGINRPADWFWKQKDHPLFPYNIGARLMLSRPAHRRKSHGKESVN